MATPAFGFDDPFEEDEEEDDGVFEANLRAALAEQRVKEPVASSQEPE